MPLPDPQYIAGPPLMDIFLDKDTGEILSAGIVTFYKDTERTVLKDIYQQVRLPDNTYDFVPLANPLTLSSIGTFVDSDGNNILIYYFPYEGTPGASTGEIELYYITVYAAAPPVGDGALQFTVEAFPPNVSGNTNPTDTFEATVNEISNTQFARISFSPSSGVTYTVAGTDTINPIASDWDLVTSGSGSVTISQVDVIDTNAPSNPAFAIDISSSGASLTSVKLRQRLYNSPRLLAQGYASTNIVANSQSGSAVDLVINYVTSNGTTIELLNQPTTSTGFSTLTNSSAVFINTSNPNPGSTGYVDFEIVLPLLSHVQLTCVQMVGVQNITSSVEYLQQTTEQEILKYQLEYKQIPSLLVGWDFPLNPAQFATGANRAVAATAIGANKSKYAWDQTIIFQSANSGVGVTSGTSNELLLTAAATTQMAVIQYLSSTEARKILNSPICVNVSARASAATKATVSLWYTTDGSLPVILTGTNNSLVLSLDANGKPATFNGTWTEVPRAQGNALITIATSSNTNFNDYALSGWDMAGIAACNTATFFAIVVGTESIGSAGTIGFNSVSLQAGNIPTRPAPQMADDVLRDCQYYYEVSGDIVFEQLVDPAPATTTNTTRDLVSRYFSYNYSTVKISSSPLVVTVSSSTLTASRVFGIIYNGAAVSASGDINISNWTQVGLSNKSVNFKPANVSTLLSTGSIVGDWAEAIIEARFLVDARLGVV